jgi:DNA-directed RNA polymerase omega subunit
MKILQSKDLQHGFSSEAAVAAIGDRYQLVLIAARRMRELSRGDSAKVKTAHGLAVTALMEIEQGHIGTDYLNKEIDIAPRRRNKGR